MAADVRYLVAAAAVCVLLCNIMPAYSQDGTRPPVTTTGMPPPVTTTRPPTVRPVTTLPVTTPGPPVTTRPVTTPMPPVEAPTEKPIPVPTTRGRFTSPCDNGFNGGCSHLCTPGPGGAPECSCPDNMKLVNGNKVCVPSSVTTCSADQFTCANGNCISWDWRCDLDDDCLDGTDEAVNFCSTHICTDTQYSCANGKCIPSSYECDYENDCGDSSDEQQDCGFPTCVATDYTCPNSRCIPLAYLCDGEDDCVDGNMTDERNCPESTCPPSYVSCPNHNVCIFYTWACDGDNDCGDNSDEEELFCHGQQCPEGAFRCTSGACIPPNWKCDGEADCPDGADEDLDSTCDPELFTCPAGYFECDNGNCIPNSWKCDTDNDCGDSSDEADDLECEFHTCEPGFFTCRDNRPGRNRCIPEDWVCDGDSDCEHGDDEDPAINGCVRTTCGEDFHTCDNELCVPLVWKCDHDNDCGDSSDEGAAAECTYGTCADNEFSCLNGRCIPEAWKCDSDNDCRDNSDESQCVTLPPTCPATMFQCESGQCIEHSQVCNKDADCDDGSDENRCNVDECAQISSNQCEYHCQDTATGYYCQCQTGYSLNDDEKTCRDIDECTEIAGSCSQFCENTRGGYICKCVDGYRKEPDGTTCKHTSDETPSLIFTNRYYIRNLAIDGSDYSLVADGFTNIVALDYDYREEKIYFSDTSKRQIMRINTDGSNQEVLLDSTDNIPAVQGMAVDWIARKLYWSDATNKLIEVSELDGSHRATLLYKDLFLPRAIALDPRDGLLFWTDWGLNPYIGVMGMDGSNPGKLTQITKLVWPNGLTIYYPIRKLFWIDAHLNYIGHANYDGTGFTELTGTGDLAHPFAISVFENDVYWTDWNDMAIYKADKWTLANKTLLVNTLHRPMDVHVYHPLRQNQTIPNPCSDNNGGCSHLCLLSPGSGNSATSYSCACPNNFIMNTDQKMCTANCNAYEFKCEDERQCIPVQFKCDGAPDCADASDESPDCPVRHCDRGRLQCDNLNCTLPQYICDGDNDCGDLTDEKNCESMHCLPWQFGCRNGRCVHHTDVCDQRNDCVDNSDEDPELCVSRTCSPGYFQCNNGFCIPEAWYCDYDDDCGDASDEPFTTCQSRQVTCPPGWEKCRSNYRCIPSWAFCDGADNCRDNSDEESCHERTCEVGEFQCGNHRCIPGRWQCDHDNDCGDNSDELQCTYRTCSESEWRCPTTSKCIPLRWRCDFDDDCGDGTDELLCEAYQCLTTHPTQFKCGSGHCITAEYVCDGDADCQDLSDEVDCPTRIPGGLYCPADEFTCGNHLCIPRRWRCDGDNDCGDGSDESLEICITTDCDATTSYHCDNRRCIPTWRTCDGVDNCGDSSDENNHDLCDVPVVCTEGEFKCNNDGCVTNDVVCDDYDDCGDQSDERGCYKNGATCQDNTCEEMCVPIEGGYYCACNDGLQVTDDRNGCEDVDECLSNPCPQECRNFKGGYECACATGYTQTQGNGKSCKALGMEKRMLFTDGPEIRVYDPADELYSDVIFHEGRIDAMDYDNVTLYWVDAALRAVKRASMPPVGATSISDNLKIDDIDHPQDIAVDWLGKNVYWTDQGSDDYDRRVKRDNENAGPRISVAKTDGRYVRMLIINGLDKPGAIAVNPRRGVMYWTDYGETPKIEMASMDGSNRKVIVGDRIVEPTGLSIDFANKDSVYFCDRKESLIWVMDWDGANRKVLVAQALENPFRLEVFESSIYWTTGALDLRGKIKSIDKLGRGVPIDEVTNINLPQGVKMYQEQRYKVYPALKNPCEEAKCSHMCFLIPSKIENRVTDGYKCGCPDNDDFERGSTTKCQGALVEPRPLASQGCQNGASLNSNGICVNECVCFNGGVCGWGNKCLCPNGYSGPTCAGKRSALKGGGISGGGLAGIFVIIIIVLVAVIALLFYYIRRRSKYSVKESSEGPVSYRGGTNIDLPGPPVPMEEGANGTTGQTASEFTMNGNGAGFQNPVYETSSPQLQAVGYTEPEKTGLPTNGDIAGAAVALPEKDGIPEGGIDASMLAMQPMPEVDLPPPAAFTATEAEGDTNVLVTKDDM